MRIPSGVTDQILYFVAVDATDLKTRETGLSGFAVYRARNGGAATAMTTPTVTEASAANMPGVYELLLDEDMTIAAGNDTEEMCFHITVSGMAPVTRTIELYRPKITAGNTLDVTATGAAGIDWGNVENPTTAVDLSATDIQLCDTVGGAITDILNVRFGVPTTIDLADTAVVRLSMHLTNAIDDLPTEAEISAGTIDIDRKAIGGTAWTSVVSAAGCLAHDGMIYYDEIFDSGAGYAEGDSIRIKFKSQKITVAGNDYQITETNGAHVHTEIRQTMRGTDSAATAAALTTHDGKIDTVDTNVDTLIARLSAARAGYLDELAAANIPADVDTTLARLTAARAGYLDALNGHTAQTGDSYTRIGAPAGASVSADVAAVQSDTNDIQTRIPAALVTGRMSSDVVAVGGSTEAADKLEAGAKAVIIATVAASPTPTTTACALTFDNSETPADDTLIGREITFSDGGSIEHEATAITDFVASTGIVTYNATTAAPASTDKATIH